MRQASTASQKDVLGEVVELSPHANQEPVQVHVHVGDGGTTATRGRFPLLGIIGMATIGIVAYSLYQGQPVSITVGQIETSISSTMTPQWWTEMKKWWENRIGGSEQVVMEARAGGL